MFVPNKLVDIAHHYQHSEDCKMSGCPGHIATFKYQSTVDIFSVDFGDGKEIVMDMTQAELLVNWFNKLQS